MDRKLNEQMLGRWNGTRKIARSSKWVIYEPPLPTEPPLPPVALRLPRDDVGLLHLCTSSQQEIHSVEGIFLFKLPKIGSTALDFVKSQRKVTRIVL